MLELPKFYEGLKAFELVWAERLRQKAVEGYTPAHDDEHTEGQLALLAAAYALASQPSTYLISVGPFRASLMLLIDELRKIAWPFKPKDPISNLVRAGALILAELERRLRAEKKK